MRAVPRRVVCLTYLGGRDQTAPKTVVCPRRAGFAGRSCGDVRQGAVRGVHGRHSPALRRRGRLPPLRPVITIPPSCDGALICCVAGVLAVGPSARAAEPKTWDYAGGGQWPLAKAPVASTTQGQPVENPTLDRAERLLKQKRADDAESLILEWVKSHRTAPDRDRGLSLLAQSYYQQGDRLRAFYQLDELLVTYPESKYYYPALEKQYQIADDFLRGAKRKFLGLYIIPATDEAIEMLYRIQERSPGSALAERAMLRTADYYYNTGQFDLASDVYTAYLRSYPRSPEVPRVSLRRAFSAYAQFHGVRFDSTPLIEARASSKTSRSGSPTWRPRRTSSASSTRSTTRWRQAVGDRRLLPPDRPPRRGGVHVPGSGAGLPQYLGSPHRRSGIAEVACRRARDAAAEGDDGAVRRGGDHPAVRAGPDAPVRSHPAASRPTGRAGGQTLNSTGRSFVHRRPARSRDDSTVFDPEARPSSSKSVRERFMSNRGRSLTLAALSCDLPACGEIMRPRRRRIPDCHSRFSPAGVRSMLLGVCCLLALGTGGCGFGTYQQSGSVQNAPAGYQWSSQYRGDVKSVAVPVFANKTFYRGFEFNLTKAVVNQLEGQSPYKVMPKERADTILEGEVERVRVRTISNSPFNSLPQEQLLEVTVNFTWKDLPTAESWPGGTISVRPPPITRRSARGSTPASSRTSNGWPWRSCRRCRRSGSAPLRSPPDRHGMFSPSVR